MTAEQEYKINGYSFTVVEGQGGWCWEKNSDDHCWAVDVDGGPFESHIDALQDAMRYVGELEAEEREEATITALEEEEARYGSYEQQVRDTYYDNCL